MEVMKTFKNSQTWNQFKQKKVKIYKVKIYNQLKILKVEANSKISNKFKVDFYYPSSKKTQEQTQWRIQTNKY